MTDLVIQSLDLRSDAIDAFRVGCLARRVRRHRNSARLIGIADDADTRKVARALSAYWKCDAAFVRPDWRLAEFRLLALDMDSTLIDTESLDEVAALAGKGTEVAAITEAAMRGEIADYRDSLRRRVAMLTGVDASLLQQVYEEKLRLNPGAEALIRACKAAGLKTLLVTGGFRYFSDRIRQRLDFDFACSNELDVVDGRLTGRVSGPPENDGEIIDADGKARALQNACAHLACSTAQSIVFGDGANDLKMMKLAGMSVAFHAMPVVQRQATEVLNYSGLDGALAWFTDTEV